MGGAEVVWGGSATVELALSRCPFSPPDEFADSNASIPAIDVVRGCKGIGWEGVWEELFVRDQRCS